MLMNIRIVKWPSEQGQGVARSGLLSSVFLAFVGGALSPHPATGIRVGFIGEQVHLRSFTFPQSSSWAAGQLPCPSEAELNFERCRTVQWALLEGRVLVALGLASGPWFVLVSPSPSTVRALPAVGLRLPGGFPDEVFPRAVPLTHCHTSLNLLFPPLNLRSLFVAAVIRFCP